MSEQSLGKAYQVFVDFETETIEIEGENFDRVSPLTITLGDPGTIGDITQECVVDTASAPQVITCTLVDGLPEPGDYLLTLAGGPPPWTVSYDLTIGAVGRRDPQGRRGRRGHKVLQASPATNWSSRLGRSLSRRVGQARRGSVVRPERSCSAVPAL